MLVSVTPEFSQKLQHAGAVRISHVPCFPHWHPNDLQRASAVQARQRPSYRTHKTLWSSECDCIEHWSKIKGSEAQKWDSWLVLLTRSDFVNLLVYYESKMELWFISCYVVFIAFRTKGNIYSMVYLHLQVTSHGTFGPLPACKYVLLVALGLTRSLKAAPRCGTLKCITGKAWHNGKLQHSGLNEVPKNKGIFSNCWSGFGIFCELGFYGRNPGWFSVWNGAHAHVLLLVSVVWLGSNNSV